MKEFSPTNLRDVDRKLSHQKRAKENLLFTAPKLRSWLPYKRAIIKFHRKYHIESYRFPYAYARHFRFNFRNNLFSFFSSFEFEGLLARIILCCYWIPARGASDCLQNNKNPAFS